MSPRTAFGGLETTRLIQVALDQLPTHYGDALEWKYVYGFSVDEIAAKLGIGFEAAQSLLARAKRAISRDLRCADDRAPERPARGGPQNGRGTTMNNEREPEQRLRAQFEGAVRAGEAAALAAAADTEEIRRAVMAEWEAVTGPRKWRRRAGSRLRRPCCWRSRFGLEADSGRARRRPSSHASSAFKAPSMTPRGRVSQSPAPWRSATGCRRERGPDRAAPRKRRLAAHRAAQRGRAHRRRCRRARQRRALFRLRASARGAEFSVRTAVGTVQDVGTQFVMRLDGGRGGLDVGVRDGRVVLTNTERIGHGRERPAARRHARCDRYSP